jgi:hypothetical protein
MSDYADFCREQRQRKQKALEKRIDCPWSNYTHKTWPGETCLRCMKDVDKNGQKVF